MVRLRFWGAINSPATSVSPIEEIESAWCGKPPEFGSPEEAEAFFERMVEFWNTLAQCRVKRLFVELAPQADANRGDGLRDAMEARWAELDGFLSGFIGPLRRDDPIDDRIDAEMSKLFELLDELQELAEKPLGPKSASKIRSLLNALTKRAQRQMNEIVALSWM